MKIFIFGIAGMIGYHIAKKMSEIRHEVTGLDNFNNYYKFNLKNN